MPITFGSLPFDVAAFFGGAILEHRRTLSNFAECLQNERVKTEVQVAKIGAVVTIVGSLIAIEVTYHYDWGLLNMDAMSLAGKIITLLLWNFFLAGGMVCICYSAIVLSFERFNYKTPLTAMLARAAYAVYIIHPPVVCLMTYSWVGILASGAIHCDFPADGLTSPTPMPTGLIVAGWVYTVALSQLIVWPLAHYFRQLPVVRDYL
jgi:peptidoglycan/LPS O-acetylase OafA/YrhL